MARIVRTIPSFLKKTWERLSKCNRKRWYEHLSFTVRIDKEAFFNFISEYFLKDKRLKWNDVKKKRLVYCRPRLIFGRGILPGNNLGVFSYRKLGDNVILSCTIKNIIIDLENVADDVKNEKDFEVAVRRVLVHEAAHWCYHLVHDIPRSWIERHSGILKIVSGLWAGAKTVFLFLSCSSLLYLFFVVLGHFYGLDLLLPDPFINRFLLTEVSLVSLAVLVFYISSDSYNIFTRFLFFYPLSFSPSEKFALSYEYNDDIILSERWNEIILIEIN